MSYYGGSIKGGVWSEDDHRNNNDCPDPSCYACKGKGSYWCGMVGCTASAKQLKSGAAQKEQCQKEQRDKIIELAEAWAHAKWSESGDAEMAFKDYVNKIHVKCLLYRPKIKLEK